MLQVGDRAPDFVLPTVDGTVVRFYGRVGGRPTAVVFPASPTSVPTADALVAALVKQADVDVCWIAPEPPPGLLGVLGWVDTDGNVCERFGAVAAVDTVVVLDPNLRVLGVVTGGLTAAPILALLERGRHAESTAIVSGQAPVLIIPRVVDEAMCADLIARCKSQSVETGVEKSGTGGRAESLDQVLKRRRDLTVTDRAELAALSATVGRRLMPEVERTFAFRATRFEGFKIACYGEDSGGFFAPHRDNLTVATAHRVFGLSINLNEDYDGGELGFPEYGRERYRAPAGAAMVFSCALLHTVHPVVRGERFVLLSFLYADVAGAHVSGK